MIQLDSVALDTLDSDSPSPAQNAANRDSHGQAMALIEDLPENQREVIRLRFQSDLSYREIAEITELSVNNVGFLLRTVTVFYDIVPTGVDAWSPNEAPLKYRSVDPDTLAPQDGAF